MTHLFAVRMDVALPPDMDPAERAALLSREKAYSQVWHRSGHRPQIYRCVGEYANLSIFAVVAYMTMTITPLAVHPSDVAHAGN